MVLLSDFPFGVYIMEKFVFVVTKYNTLDMRIGIVGQFDTVSEAESFWWDTIQKNLEEVQNGSCYYVESLRVA